ncbi:hypothetical protein HYT23_06230 [Candidatus Pacearchaeota archaeon]|nr:hypothetical protein [Candidatus Pacearchaeota archaeon]
MNGEKVFTDFNDFLRTCLPNYYEEIIYGPRNKEEITPEEAGRRLAKEILGKINIDLSKLRGLEGIK